MVINTYNTECTSFTITRSVEINIFTVLSKPALELYFFLNWGSLSGKNFHSFLPKPDPSHSPFSLCKSDCWDTSRKRIHVQWETVCVCFPSLFMVSSGFIHVIACGRYVLFWKPKKISCVFMYYICLFNHP